MSNALLEHSYKLLEEIETLRAENTRLREQQDRLADLLIQYSYDGEFFLCCSVRANDPHKEWCEVGAILAEIEGEKK